MFSLGKAISGAPTCNGKKILPNPPINAGITIKKIIKNAWAVIITLNNWWSPCKNCTPGADNSNLINTENPVPNIPAKIANTRYNIPISFALVE